MSADLLILAARDEDPTTKIVIGLVVAAFWIVTQVVSALNKKADKSLPPSGPRAPVPPAPRADPVRLPPKSVNPPRPPKRAKPPALRGKPQRPSPRSAPPVAAPAPFVAEAPLPRPVHASPRRDLMEAVQESRSLKRAFVLTELLAPPVALRGPSDQLPRA